MALILLDSDACCQALSKMLRDGSAVVVDSGGLGAGGGSGARDGSQGGI